MISDKTRANRLRRHRVLKKACEVQLFELAEGDPNRKHLKARIAEIDRDIVTTKGDSVEEGLPEAEKEYVEARLAEIADRERLEGVILPEPKALLPTVTKTVEEESKVAHPHKTKRIRKKRVGNPF